MTTETVLTNARLVLEDRIVAGSLVFRDGVIAEIAEGNSASGVDMEGDYILPGLVELHTDHLGGALFATSRRALERDFGNPVA